MSSNKVETISDAEIKHVVDHHRIANFETASPLWYRAEPVGCTATILYKMYKERGFEIKPHIAGLMISQLFLIAYYSNLLLVLMRM